MAKVYVAPILSAALKKFREIIRGYGERGGGDGRLIVFCEDRLSLVAERAVCEELGGTFSVSVFTLSRFLSRERGRQENTLTKQGSAMAIRRLIEKNAAELKLLRRLSTPAAAQEVYDTIALLYSSGISYDDIKDVGEGSELLRRKLHDISLLYGEYARFLSESGAVDRNAYLRALPGAIKNSKTVAGADVLFLGFNAFTSTVRESVRACMQTARRTFGVFIGDGSDVRLYQNEALEDFLSVSKSCAQKCEVEYTPSYLTAEAEHLRRNIFNPESLNKSLNAGIGMDISPGEYGLDPAVSVTEAEDGEEECVFIAAHILKCVQRENIKPHRISVMVPDLAKYQPVIERVFNEYSIPFYVDRRYPLTSGFICSFVCDYIAAASDGMRADSVTAVVGNPLFRDRELSPSAGEGGRGGGKKRISASARDKELFVNYLLRAAPSRGGAAREVDRDACADMCRGGTDKDAEAVYSSVCAVREKFLSGIKLLPRKGDGRDFCDGVRALLKYFCIEEKLNADSLDTSLRDYPSLAAMSARAYGAFCLVLDEAEKLAAGEVMTARSFLKILKSGLAATEISLIPPKQGAVFVGDICSTANSGSDIIFAAGLTDAVPKASQDISLLTDGELSSVGKLRSVSPKISQLNKRVRELTALNVCAFSKRLYLVYPVRSGGEACVAGEIIQYARALFTSGGKELTPISAKAVAGGRDNIAYYLSNPAAAIRMLAGGRGDSANLSTVYALLKDKGADACLAEGAEGGAQGADGLGSGAKLYGKSISPTTLETFFSCPYKCFMQRGLRLEERKEGVGAADSGNFIHAVLEETAHKLGGMKDAEECARTTGEIARQKLGQFPYSSLCRDGQGEYIARSLVEEAENIARGMYNQLAHSSFEVSATECACSVPLGDGITVGGRIDRVDSCGDIVRVIDYKTGFHDDKADSYYMGLKLQLPLYLSAAAENKRPAGAYYFPARVEYSSKYDGDFCLKGFMDGSEDIVRISDDTVQDKQRSAYVNAYLNGKKLSGAMEREEFGYFIEYSRMIAESGAKSMLGGFVRPSPAEKACEYCAFSSCCMYDTRYGGVREKKSADCERVARIAREAKQKGED